MSTSTENTTVIRRFQLDDRTLQTVSDRAHAARPGRAALGLIGAILFAIGWLIAKTLKGFFYCFAWTFAAVAVGWRQARGEPAGGPTMEQLLRENDALRKENARLTPTMS